MTRLIVSLMTVGLILVVQACTTAPKPQGHATQADAKRQELTHSRDWVKAWDTCSGYTALKKDGTLWQFGKVGECNWGQIIPVDPQTGKPIYKKKTIYHLKPRQIGAGFERAKFVNRGDRMYAIKRDGTLWGWGEGVGIKAKKLSASRGWSDFGIRLTGHDCCNYDIGLKKDGTLWSLTDKKLEKISLFSDWKKIVLGCCSVYGVRRDGSLWRSSFYDKGADGKMVFKRYKAKKGINGGDMELYPYLRSNMAKVPSGVVYDATLMRQIKVGRDGTLFLLPEAHYY